MKQLLFLLCGIFYLQTAVGQRSSGFVAPDLLFKEGKSMYDAGNYAGCTEKLISYKKTVTAEREFVQEADFMLVASGFYQGKGNIVVELKKHIDEYPVTIHRDEICFMIGSAHFKQNEYQLAVYWFSQADLDKLSLVQQEDYAYRMGISYIETDNNKEAKRLFHLLGNNSSTYLKAANYYLAYIHYSEKDYTEALSLFNAVKDAEEFKPDVLYYLTQINFIQGHYQQAIKEGSNLLKSYPSHKYNAEMYRLIGLSYYQEVDYAKTVEYLSQHIDLEDNPKSEDLYVLGLSYFYRNDYPKAIANLSKSNPGNDLLGQNIYLHLGQAYLKQADTQKALMAFQSASRMDFDRDAKEASLYNYAMLLHQNSVSAFGESVTVLEDFLNSYPKSIYADRVNDALVDVYLTTKNYDTALSSIAKIKNPGNKIREAEQKIYYYLGTVHFTNSNYPEAIQYFTKAISAGNYAMNEKSESSYWRGEAYYKSENYQKASSDFQAYLNSGNKSGNLSQLAVYNLAYCAFNQQQYTNAEKFLQRYIASDRNQSATLADAYARLGDCYFFNRRFSDAENAYNQSVATMPSTGDYALYQKAYVLGLQKNYSAKITQMDKLIAEYPESPYMTDALYEKGRTYVLMENTNAAIETYRILSNRFPESSNARKAGLQIGLLYFNANLPQQAADAYKTVIEKYPGSDEAKIAVQDLKSVYLDLNDINAYAEYVKSLGGMAKFDVTEQDSLTYIAAERFFMRNDVKQAQTGMINYLQSFPAGAFSTNAHYYLGQTYYTEKNHSAAKQEFYKVLEAGNNQFTEETLVRLSELQYTDEEYEEALQSYERLQNTAENKANRETGSLGLIRTASRLQKFNQVVTAANLLLKSENPEPSVTSEAKYYRAKALLALNENTLAESDLKDLSKDTRTAFGAEAKYLLSQVYFDGKQTAKAKDVIQDYIKQGTPHAYWLARSFILMSDIYIAEGDNLQARQYLESLQNNYKATNDDIHSMINNRLEKL